MKYNKIIDEIYNTLPASKMRCKHYSVVLSGNKIICSAINHDGCHAESDIIKKLQSPKGPKGLQEP